MFAAWGRFVYRFRWLVLVASILSIAAVVYSMGYGGRLGTGEFSAPGGTESGRVDELLDEEVAKAPPSFMLVFGSEDEKAADPAFRDQVERALEPLEEDERVAGVRTAYENGATDEAMISRNGHYSLAVVELEEGSFAELQDAYADIRQEVRPGPLEVVATGEIPLNEDFESVTETDLKRAEVVSLPLALLMLLFVFGSVVAAGLPIGVGVLAVTAGFVGTLLLARAMDVSIYATNIVTMIGLGVAIDYSLFVVSRFREEVGRRPVPEALARTMATAGRAILFSGLTVAIGFMGFLFFDVADLNSIGFAGSIVVAFSVLYGLTFLPALLAILGPRVDFLHLPFARPERLATGSGLWHRVARSVMAHPWRTLLPVVALLLVLGSPFLGIRLGLSGGDTLPPDTESRRGEEILDRQFPDSSAYPMVVLLDYPQGSPLTRERIGEMYDLSRWLEERPGVKDVESIVNLAPKLSRDQYQELLSGPRGVLPSQVREALKRTTGDHIAVLTAYTSVGYNTEEAHDLVREVRGQHPEVGGEVLVGGWAAFDLDLTDSVYDAAPPAIAFVVLATYVVLFLLLGSVLLPIKAVFVNFLSISASYGALVWIFQEGHLSGLLDFTPGPINTTTPIIMFCILFGLSMDYEVMLLSRIKEEYERTGDNLSSVTLGIERTGRLITGAALIMATVFFSFGLAEAVVIKAIGLGMGLAVLVDATIIRALLVPATMRLMGGWNWWAPEPLARLHRRLGLSEEPFYAPDPAAPPPYEATPPARRR
ncbi:MAG: MMPL family transporter [Actinomycetota bacterium]|nr:MMPL family transporter [Rubrobacteraceae bacterium]MDQ3496838.1 MMPL family transporter [Actinomycetota bacterium]